MKQILKSSATKIGEKILKQEICPIKLTELYLEQIRDATNSHSIFTTVLEHRAISSAKMVKKALDKKITKYNPLTGVTVAWKDLFDTAKITTEAGSQLLQGRLPKYDSQVIKNVESKGLISVAKTHMTELAFSGLGVNPKTKTPPNAINPSLAPGGSSSGSAVSVALNLVSCAIGSDTGGSIRVPAAWNNLVGFKPTHGLISVKGVVPLCPKFDTIGPIVKSVEDAANVFTALLCSKPFYFLETRLEDLQLALIETIFLDNIDKKIKDEFEANIEFLEKHGVKITRINSTIVRDIMDLAVYLYSSEAYGTWSDVIEKNPKKMYKPILERFRSGAKIDAPTYVKAEQTLKKLRKLFSESTKEFDLFVAPTTPILPPTVQDLLDSDSVFVEKNLLTLRNTRVANLLNLPAITLPTGANFCGLMLMGKTKQDFKLLNIANVFEAEMKKRN